MQQRLFLGLRAAQLRKVLKIVSQVESRGELSSRSSTTSPRSCCLLGTEQMTQPAPTLQQSQGLLVKFGLVGSHSAEPKQNQKLKGGLMKSGLLGPEQMTRPAPALQQWQKTVGESRPLPGIAKQSATTKPGLVEKSSGAAGPSWSRANGDSAAATAAVKSAGETRSSGS